MLLGKISESVQVQEKTLDAAWLRNEVLAHNIANVETPIYNRKDVDFESYLQSALGGDLDDVIVHRRHQFRMGASQDVSAVSAKVTEDYNTMAMRIDGNNVDVDEEMAEMAKNQIKYNVVTQNLNGKFTKLRHVITEGRK
ncbi:MAG: flagellar basal body rod protein FlgB [Clostridiales bacterium]|jgi:flagellar basal-body rod protein FlgB|nr:flagellar basal body rod protein FlgB [Clostridiales bacterium]